MNILQLRQWLKTAKPTCVRMRVVGGKRLYDKKLRVWYDADTSRKVRAYEFQNVTVLGKALQRIASSFSPDAQIYENDFGIRVVHSRGYHQLRNIAEVEN